MISKRWTVVNGEGHWIVYVDGSEVAHCDDSELDSTIAELKS